MKKHQIAFTGITAGVFGTLTIIVEHTGMQVLSLVIALVSATLVGMAINHDEEN